MNLTSSLTTNRYHHLDWLRVLAFSILFLEHSAEIFAMWKFWIKNSETSQLLSYIIVFFLPWRMPLLFIISGAAVALSIKRKSSIAFIKDRTVRLLLPLVFALLVIIPPQLYFIKLNYGYNGTFWDFYKSIITLDLKWSTKGNIHFMHLWYLAFLFIYCILILPILQFAKSPKGNSLFEKLGSILSHPILLFSLGTIITFPSYFLTKIYSHYYFSNFCYYLPFFACGAILWLNRNIYESIKNHANFALGLGILSTSILYWLSFDNGVPRYFFQNINNSQPLYLFLLKSFNQWFWVIAIFGIAMRYLSFGCKKLNYSNKAVYPFYILHQTVIVLIGYFIVQMQGSILNKLSLIIALSFILIFLCYEGLIKRSAFGKMLFGIYNPKSTTNEVRSL